MKISIVTAAWKRHELFKFFCAYWCHLKKKYELELICAVSENETKYIAEANGFKTVFVENQPLHKKWNSAVRLAQKDNPDYCLFIGSDDIINDLLMNRYVEKMQMKVDYINCLDWYFFDTYSKHLLYWGGYTGRNNMGHPCGAGRALSRKVLEQIDWSPWPPGFDHVLDTGFDRAISRVKLSQHNITMQGNEMGMDIKTSQNMTHYDYWINTTININCKNKLAECFGKSETDKLFTLKN